MYPHFRTSLQPSPSASTMGHAQFTTYVQHYYGRLARALLLLLLLLLLLHCWKRRVLRSIVVLVRADPHIMWMLV